MTRNSFNFMGQEGQLFFLVVKVLLLGTAELSLDLSRLSPWWPDRGVALAPGLTNTTQIQTVTRRDTDEYRRDVRSAVAPWDTSLDLVAVHLGLQVPSLKGSYYLARPISLLLPGTHSLRSL